MGLFGLFAVMVGLGAVAKDAISDGIDNAKEYEIAKRDNKSVYYVNAYKAMSTKTGRRCTVTFENGHQIVRDFKTGEFIEDATLKKNKMREEEEKAKIPEGCVFYRLCTYDILNRPSNTWVSKEIPGFFSKSPQYPLEVNMERDKFYAGSIGKGFGRGPKEVQPFYFGDILGEHGTTYFADGTLVDKEKMLKRYKEMEEKEKKEKEEKEARKR